MTKRSQNECSDCGYTWYPRGKELSRVCPNCRSSHVTFYVEPYTPPGPLDWLGDIVHFYFVTLLNPWGFMIHLIIYAFIFVNLEAIKIWFILTGLGTLGFYGLKWLVSTLWMKFCKKG